MINFGDFIEVYFKLKQRGFEYLFSKISIQKNIRIKSTFDHTNQVSSNYWLIPEVTKKWNKMISGKEDENYAEYITRKYFRNQSNIKILSLGCGSGSNEIKFAKHPEYVEIIGVDIATKLIEKANINAREKKYSNLNYEVKNIYETEFEDEYFDMILFHSSLHHFHNLDFLLGQKIKKIIKKNGLIVIHEYVGPNRIQWSKEQLNETNSILKMIPDEYKRRFKLKNLRTKAYRPGKLRMIISDPSEAVESENILPMLHKYYETIEEKKLGGNIIMPLFKDIAHNFLDESAQTKKSIEFIFEKENAFLKDHSSDFIFGVYRKV